MTAYFDDADNKLRDIAEVITRGEDTQAAVEAEERLRALDKIIVWDVTLCTEAPGFPIDLREAIHRTILRLSPEGQPRKGSVLDYATMSEHVGLVRELIYRLHDQFHSLGRRRLERFTDDPRTPLWEMQGDAEELRERLALEALGNG